MRFDTGWLVTFSFFFILVEKNLLRNFLSVAKMASLVYERENCVAALVIGLCACLRYWPGHRLVFAFLICIPEVFSFAVSYVSACRLFRGGGGGEGGSWG